MNVITRFFVIVIAFFIASFAGGLVVAVAVLLPEWSNLALGPLDQDMVGVMATFGWIFISGFALMPALVVIAIAEALSIRTALYYALAGALIGFVAYATIGGFDAATLRFDGFSRREIEIMLGAGIVSGLVYWLIAGRKAGRWRVLPPPA